MKNMMNCRFSQKTVLIAALGVLVSCGAEKEETPATETVKPAKQSAQAAAAKPEPSANEPAKDQHEHHHHSHGAPIDCPFHNKKQVDAGEHHDHKPFKSTKEYIAFLDRKDRSGWQKPNGVVVTLDLEGTETVVDLGAGSGYFSFPFAKALPLGKVIALDTDNEMVQHINERAKRQKVKNVHARLIKPDDPEIDSSTNLLFMCNVLHHVPSPKDYLKNLYGKLPKGARFVVIEFKEGDLPVGPPEEMKIPKEKILKMVRKAGFKLEKEHKAFLPYQHLLEFKRP